MRRRLGWLIAALVVLVVGLVAFAYALVNGGLLPKLTNANPGVFAMTYRQAKLVPPLSVEVDDVEFHIQSDGFRVRIIAAHATGSFMPFDLARLRVSFTGITARGVSVFVRLPEPSEGTKAERLPPVDGMAEPSPPTPGPLFSVALTGLSDVQVNEVWVDGFRYQGEIDVSGGFVLQPTDSLVIEPSTVIIDGGVVTLPNGLEAKVDPSSIAGQLRSMPLDVPLERAMFRAVDADVKLGFQAPNLNLINSLLLGDLRDVQLLYGAGGVAMDLGVDGGVLNDGSALTISPRDIGVRVPHFDVVGRASIEMKVKEDRVYATLLLPAFELDSRNDDKQVATGKNFVLNAVTGSNDLTAVRHVDVSLKLADAHAPDLKFLDRFIPAGSGVILVGGAGHVTVDATLSTRTNQAKGKLVLDAKNLELRNRSALITGAANVVGLLDSFDLQRRHMDLRGSHVKLTGVTVKTRPKTYTNVSLSAVAPEALWAPDTEHPWKAKLAVGVSNLQPLLGIVSANVEMPQLVVGLLDVPDVAASAELDVMKKQVRLVPMAMTARDLRVDARVQLDEQPDQEMAPRGVALVKLGPLTAGMAIDGGVVTPIIFGAPEWYAKQVEAGVP